MNGPSPFVSFLFICYNYRQSAKPFSLPNGMDAVEHFSDFLAKIGAPNVLTLGIVIVLAWLLISGIRKGLKKGNRKDNDGKKDR